MGKAEALKLAAGVEQLYVAKGTRFVHVDLKKEKLSNDDLAALLLGPTGNLRAPTIKSGKKLMVGFNRDAYEDLFG